MHSYMFTLVENELNALSMALATSWRSTGAQVTHEDCGGFLFGSMVPTETSDHEHGFLFGPVALAKVRGPGSTRYCKTLLQVQ